MLFGTLIFIKKSGGDGSRFPVTNKSLKIGRSDDCIIRIQNPLVSPEHCQLTVDDNGQAKIRNLSTTNPTILNDQPLGNGEFVLHQGDVFKLGERYARWEYQPTSKYYNQPSDSSQRLVAVVPPQGRSSVQCEESSSANYNESLGRRFSGIVIPESEAVKKKTRLSLCATRSTPNKKIQGRRSLPMKRLPFSPQVKLRKSAKLEGSGTPNSNSRNGTPVRRSSTWEVKTVTPEKGEQPKKVGSNRKSTPIKMPMTHLVNDKVMKSAIRSAAKIPNLLTITETSPLAAKMTATRSLDEVLDNLNMSPKSPIKLAKTPTPKKINRKSPRKSLSKSNRKKSLSQSNTEEVQALSHSSNSLSRGRDSLKFTPSGKTSLRKSMLRKSVFQTDFEELGPSEEKGTPKKMQGTPKESKIVTISPMVVGSLTIGKESDESPRSSKQTPVKSKVEATTEQSKSSGKTNLRKSMLRKSVFQTDLEDLGPSKEKGTPKKMQGTSEEGKIVPKSSVIIGSLTIGKESDESPRSSKQTPVKSKVEATMEQSKSSVSSASKYGERFSRGKKSIPSGVLSTPKEKENVKSSPRMKPASGRKSVADASNKTPEKRGKKRELSAVASAERAAKKLKTIAPTKPDKNKKAALLVLGKASGKLKALQNANVVIKQKIVKKAIKQSTKSRKRIKAVKKSSPKKTASPKTESSGGKKSAVASPEGSISSRRHSTPNEKSHIVETSPSKNDAASKTKSFSQGRRSSKSLSSPGAAESSSFEILNNSVPSKVSEDKSIKVSPNVGNASFQLDSQILYDASRRASKRLSSQNASSRPEFTELSPTALGLTPKTVVQVSPTKRTSPSFVRPKSLAQVEKSKRRSSSLVTPKNKGTPSIIKSASTSKITRKSIRFSNRDFSDSSFTEINLTQSTDFDFDEIRTPDVTIDRFISPLSNQKTPKIKLKSPKSVAESLQKNITQNSPSKSGNSSPSPSKSPKTPKVDDESPVRETRSQKSPKNDLTDVEGVRQLLKTPQPQKSPKNDLTDVKGVKQLLKTPKQQRSPKNDLTDVRGVRQLLKTPQPQKSPKNDLTDVKGVKQLLKTPKQQRSPKNDLTDVRGVRQLLKTPQPQKSPKNDLTDVKGVKQLLKTPKQQKSPKNDLRDVRGVRRLMTSPKQQKSPRNDLSDVRGVKRLMESPRQRKSPRNDLTDVTGVKQLLTMKSPNNDLTNVSGLDTLFTSPPNKIQCLRTLYNPFSKSPDLTCVTGFRQLFSMNKENNNLNVSLTGVAEFFLTPEKSDSPRKRARDVSVTGAAAKESRTGDVQSEDAKPALRRTARSTTRAVKESADKRKSRVTEAQSPNKSDEDSPQIVRRTTRNTRAAKAEKPVEVKKTRTKSEREVEDDVAVEVTSGRRTRATSRAATRQQQIKREAEVSESPKPVKRIRKVTLVEDKPATPAKSTAASKTKKETAKDATPESKPSPIRTRRKSVLKQSPNIVKRSTRANTKITQSAEVSPIKTRQRKAKEVSPADKNAKSSPVRTRRRAK